MVSPGRVHAVECQFELPDRVLIERVANLAGTRGSRRSSRTPASMHAPAEAGEGRKGRWKAVIRTTEAGGRRTERWRGFASYTVPRPLSSVPCTPRPRPSSGGRVRNPNSCAMNSLEVLHVVGEAAKPEQTGIDRDRDAGVQARPRKGSPEGSRCSRSNRRLAQRRSGKSPRPPTSRRPARHQRLSRGHSAERLVVTLAGSGSPGPQRR